MIRALPLSTELFKASLLRVHVNSFWDHYVFLKTLLEHWDSRCQAVSGHLIPGCATAADIKGATTGPAESTALSWDKVGMASLQAGGGLGGRSHQTCVAVPGKDHCAASKSENRQRPWKSAGVDWESPVIRGLRGCGGPIFLAPMGQAQRRLHSLLWQQRCLTKFVRWHWHWCCWPQGEIGEVGR